MSKSAERLMLRSLRGEELSEMVRLWSAAGLPSRPRGRDSMARLKKQWRVDHEMFLGAFDGSRLVGVALLSHDGRKGWINRLAVHPGYRNRGIAKALIAKSEKLFRKKSMHIFCAHIEHDQPESMQLFENSGYRREKHIYYYTKRDSQEY